MSVAATTHAGAKNQRLAFMLALLVVGMVGLSYAAVPLYELFCRVTGFGGTPQTIDVVAPDAGSVPLTGAPAIKVRFDSNVAPNLPWKFGPKDGLVEMRVGEPQLAVYRAVNTGTETVIGQATFNVSPHKMGQYFSKLECFCFTEQKLAPGESVDMPVQFFIDPAMLDDPNTKDVAQVTLSYTFYRQDEADRN